MAPSLRAECQAPDPESVVTVSDLAAYSIRQGGALKVCDEARKTVVGLIDNYTAATAPKRKWWRFGK